MKKILLSILPVLIVVAVAFTLFGVLQAQFTKEKLMEDLEAKAKTVAESMEPSIRYALVSNDKKTLVRLAAGFQKRKRLQGCIIYNNKGKVLAITEKFLPWEHEGAPYVKKVLASQVALGALEKFRDYSVYSYVLPIVSEKNKTLGLVKVIYDTSSMFNMLAILWQRISITLILLVVMIVAIVSLVQRTLFILPVKNLTEWFRHFQKGEIDKLHAIKKDEGELSKLASEVEQVALSLRIARRAVTDKAQQNVAAVETWTEHKLRELVQAKLGNNAFIVVSNREPFMHIVDENRSGIRCIRPAGGVVTAIDPMLRALGGTWVAHGAGSADKKFVNSKDKLGVPPEDNRYILKRVWLTKEEEEGYYFGFSNEGLWPLCHITYTRPVFRESDWLTYKQVNQKFADAILDELPSNNPIVFIQDYHFTLLAKMIKDKRPDAVVALFWHIPWPNPEVFSICPYQQEVLEGMLACDLIGFHLQYYCNNFIDTVNRLTECRVDMERFSIIRAQNESLIKAFPISISDSFPQVSKTMVEKIRDEWGLKEKVVALGVDRLDYTKGLGEKILAVDRFLDKYPQYKNKFVLIQIAAPSRTHISRYHELGGEIDELVDKVNWKHSNGSWKPIVYLAKHFSLEEVLPYYIFADICIVSSLHDGMNLVAKEYVMANDVAGVLVLSCFAGAAKELDDAIIINPYATEDFAEAIRIAIEMDQEERSKRMTHMKQNIKDNNIYKWAASIINELVTIKRG